MYSSILPVQIGDSSGIYDWNGVVQRLPHMVEVSNQTLVGEFLSSMQESRFSASDLGGPLDSSTSLGVDHPTSLGTPIDTIPKTVRDIVGALSHRRFTIPNSRLWNGYSTWGSQGSR